MSSNEDLSDKILHFWPDFLAGCVAGSSGVIIGHPLDTIKVRKQSSYKFPRQADLFTKLESSSFLTQFRVLYRGMLFPLMSEGVRQSVFFGFYGFTLKHLESLRKEGHWYGGSESRGWLSPAGQKYLDVAIASLVGGSAQAFIATPVEQIKVLKQAERSYDRRVISINEIMKNALKSRYFFKHTAQTLWVTLLRESYSFMVYMMAYVWVVDEVAELMEEYRDEERGRFTNKALNDVSNSMFSGGMAGVFSWALCMPLDNVKTRLQVEFCSPSPRYSGIRDCFVKMHQQEGFRSLWNGMGVVCLRAFPVNAVVLTVYTYSLNWFNYFS